MSEQQGKGSPLPSEQAASAGSPLQQSFMRLQQADRLRQERKFDQAQAICESLIRQYPNYVGALYTLGLVFSNQDKYEYALDCLVRALMLNPQSQATLAALAAIYLRFGANEMAAQTLEQAELIKPQDAKVLLMLGDVYQEDCEYERARDTYRRALAIEPDLVPAAIGFGWCYYFLGEYCEAAKVFQDLIERGVLTLEPVRALTYLPASVVNIDLLAHLDKVLKQPSEDQAEFDNTVIFFRAIALDRAGHYAKAWENLTKANRAVFLAMQDRLGQFSERWRTSLDLLRANPGKAGRHDDAGQTISLFILAPSRGGKTTMEQLISKLAGVKRGYESPIIRDTIRRTFQTSSLLTRNLLELPPHLYPLCREYYSKELARRAGSARVFTNTNPGYIHAAAHLVEIFQNVRFIFVKRNLEDNLLRIYMARYRDENAYSYDLKAARDYILWYHQMMDLMAKKFPDIVRVINYEDIVANPAAALSVAAELCGLAIPDEPPPTTGTDYGCAKPYQQFIAAELES